MDRISHYEILQPLGQGGMGEVFEAMDLDLGRRVALKFLAAHYVRDPEALRRFEREARAAAALHHPRIATVFGFDRTTDRPFIVMELLEGRSLRDTMAGGPMAIADALAVARDVADALAFAHRAGVVHRDIKPENLIFDANGAIKITDFGLARTAEALRMTTTGSTLGTAAYMAPESLPGVRGATAEGDREGADASGAPGDVFALGVTLHEMLAGVTPFRGDGPLAMLYSIVNEPPTPIVDARPEVGEEVAGLIARMLEKDPVARVSAADVARALGSPTGPHAPVPARARARRRPVPLILLLVGLTMIAGGIPLWMRQGDKGRERQAVVLNNEGHDSLAAGKLDPARRRFESALKLVPRYSEAKLNLAAALHRTGEDNKAAALYGEVIAADRRRPDLLAAAHYGLGEIDLQSEAWPSAIEHLAEASRLDSTRVEYPNNLSFALTRAGHPDQALATVRAALARFPGEAALLKNAALAWFQVGRYDSAYAAASEAVRLRPLYPAAWLIKERAEVALGDVDSARESFKTLLTLGADPGMVAEGEAALREAAQP